MKREAKIEIGAYIKARVAMLVSPKYLIFELCRIHGRSAATLRQVFRWVKKFQGGQSSLRDSIRQGRPVVAATKKNIDIVRRMVKEDVRYTISQKARTLGISEGIVHHILTDRL